MSFRLLVAAMTAASLLGACAQGAAAAPAVLDKADPATMAALEAALARAMGGRIELGPDDPTASSTITAAPPPPSSYEDRSLAKPTVFDIVLDGGRCFVVRRDTGERFELKGVACRPAGQGR